MAEGPKSTYEIVMERLRRKDAEAGTAEPALTEQQKAAIAEARSVYEARVAERRIMHQAALAGARDPTEREQLEEQFRRDLGRFESDRDSKIRKIREGPTA